MRSTIRPAREEDLDRLIEIHLHAYPDPRGEEERRRNFAHNTLGRLEDLRVVERGGAIVGHGFLFPLATWLGGEPVAVGGIASIGVAPEARGERVAADLLASMHEEMIARGFALALLYPFRERFYARHGFSETAPLVLLEVAASSLRGPLGPLARASVSPPPSLRAVGLAGRPLDEIAATYERAARRHAGWIARSRARWERMLADERLHQTGVVDDAGALRGWIAYAWDQPEVHGRARLVVRELVGDAPEVRLALLDRLGALGDQADDVALALAEDDPLLHAIYDAPGARRGTAALEHPMGRLGAGPMVRVVDPRRALAARGWAADGDLPLRVRDGEQVRALAVHARGGRAEVRDADPAAPALELALADLASLVAAGPTVAALVALGRARADDPALVARADAMLSGPRFACLDPF